MKSQSNFSLGLAWDEKRIWRTNFIILLETYRFRRTSYSQKAKNNEKEKRFFGKKIVAQLRILVPLLGQI